MSTDLMKVIDRLITEHKDTPSSEMVDKIIRFEDGKMDEDEVIAFFQQLIETGLVNHLQGSYQKTASNLLKRGLCKVKDNKTAN